MSKQDPGQQPGSGAADLLASAASDNLWEREKAHEELRALGDPTPLFDSLVEALRDPGRPDRRNAARSALAELASPDAKAPGSALDLLGSLATRDPDGDVRVLAASALGESRNPAARRLLEPALSDPDLNVAAAAVDALGVLGDERATEALVSLLQEADSWVQMAAVVSLGRIRSTRAIPALGNAATDPLLAPAVAIALGEIGDPAGLEALRLLAAPAHPAHDVAQTAAARIISSSPSVAPPDWLRDAVAGRESALQTRLQEAGDETAALLLGIAGTPAAVKILVDGLSSPHAPAATAGLARVPAPVASRWLTALLRSVPSRVRAAILSVLPPLQDPDAVEQVVTCLQDPEPEARAAAVEALARSDASLVFPHLLSALDDPGTRCMAARAMGRLGDERCGPLASLVSDPDPRVRQAAADGLSRCATPEVRSRISDALAEESDPAALRSLVNALGAAGGDVAVRDLVPLLHSIDQGLRFTVVQALGRTRSKEAFLPLLQALDDPLPEMQAAALHALGELGDPRGTEPLVQHLDIADRDLRRTAAFALRDLAPKDVAGRLLRALDDPAWSIRHASVRTLVLIGAADAIPRLRIVASDDPDPLVRMAASHAIEELTAATAGGTV